MVAAEVNFIAGLREDHYTIQASLGVALLVVGLYATLRPGLRLWVIGFLIAIAVMTHASTAIRAATGRCSGRCGGSWPGALPSWPRGPCYS
jgi:uncharacterized membrane protein HdeD (DUF308 family)